MPPLQPGRPQSGQPPQPPTNMPLPMLPPVQRCRLGRCFRRRLGHRPRPPGRGLRNCQDRRQPPWLAERAELTPRSREGQRHLGPQRALHPCRGAGRLLAADPPAMLRLGLRRPPQRAPQGPPRRTASGARQSQAWAAAPACSSPPPHSTGRTPPSRAEARRPRKKARAEPPRRAGAARARAEEVRPAADHAWWPREPRAGLPLWCRPPV
mmetsp:Transcript_41952/g.138152  ORF Transcript_41952/g.138152 Transcript_41952/m.138152 type:complete len:210 (-) Transcript_41952:521-1150(-)